MALAKIDADEADGVEASPLDQPEQPGPASDGQTPPVEGPNGQSA